ncbi:hypothetical protein MRB53_016735 [Persea americana]|uniref:Uncharacterized protein n=1 Tax=Persea americana TaxID=3435 RepID=A0ACC2M3Y6_PERAE|nr:hypothetical protein MRB53_016735 [Persea americana]
MGNKRTRTNTVTPSTPRHLAKNRSKIGLALVGAVETIASAIIEYANKRSSEHQPMLKCVEAPVELELDDSAYYRALRILKIGAKWETFMALELFHFVAMDYALTDEDDMEFFIFCAQSVALICVIGYYYSYGIRNGVHESSLSSNGFVNEMIIGHEQVKKRRILQLDLLHWFNAAIPRTTFKGDNYQRKTEVQICMKELKLLI